MIIFRVDEATGRAAIYEEAPGGGDTEDNNALMHRPFMDPGSWLANIYFHTDLDYMEVSHGPTAVVVSHAAVAAGSLGGANFNAASTMVYTGSPATHELLTHGLGYVPDFMVVVNDDLVYPGRAVQSLADGRTRSICAYADTNKVYLREWYIQSASVMPAISATYTVLVFKRPPAPSGDVVYRFDESTGILQMGKGKFSSDRRYLQVRSGGLPFGFPLGKTIDRKNGAPRLVDPDATITEPVPASQKFVFATNYQTSGFVFGASAAYNGTFTGSPAIEVQAP